MSKCGDESCSYCGDTCPSCGIKYAEAIRLPPLVRQHIQSLLDYNEDDEREDYLDQHALAEEREEEMDTHHIYTAICSIRAWMDSLPKEEEIK